MTEQAEPDVRDIEVVGGPEDSAFTERELGSMAPKPEDKASAWMWEDGVAGSGDKPDYLIDGKFKTVAEQARGYTELEKRLGTWKGAPKDGYNFDKLPEGMDKDSPLLKGFSDTFKELNLSQEGFEKVASTFADIHNSLVAKSHDEIINEVGSKDVVDRVQNWVKSLPADIQKTVESWSLSGADIKALDAIRAGRSTSSAPTATQVESKNMYETSRAVEAEKNLNFNRYRDDDAYRSEITRRWEEALNREMHLKG